jgi:hypothetical protein
VIGGTVPAKLITGLVILHAEKYVNDAAMKHQAHDQDLACKQ